MNVGPPEPPPFPSPTVPAGGRAEVFLRYLDFFRETTVAKASALPAAEPRRGHLDIVAELAGGPVGE